MNSTDELKGASGAIRADRPEQEEGVIGATGLSPNSSSLELPRRRALEEWQNIARPGSRYVYHIGHLIHDRLVSSDLDLTAAFAWELAGRDLIVLTQLRATYDGKPQYLYLATRTHKDWTGGQGGR